MSNAVYPVLPGLTAEVTRAPVWSTTIKTALSQREYRVANASYPLYRIKLSYEFLRQRSGLTEMATMVGFFNARQGSFDSFLWPDPDDNSVTTQTIGTGNGSNTLFQLVRTFGGYVEPVFDVNSAPLIYVNGVLKTLTTHYTISATGLVTFVTPPNGGDTVTWTGTYYRRVRFVQDSADIQQFMKTFWNFKTVELLSCKP